MSDCCDSSDENVFDVAVIGAGSAGFSAAITAADEGARVALIGYDTIGGTCVNVGCVPSKTLIRAAESLHNAAASKRFDGIEVTASVTDWSAVVAQKQALVDELRNAKYIDVLPSYNTIAYKEGKASFTESGDLTVDGELLDVGKIIIATGSQAQIPEIPGINTIPYLTSTTALEMEQLPASLLVIGAGYIGVETAQIFARAGVEVTIVSRRGLLPEAEPEISSALTEYFQAEGIRVLTCNAYCEIEKTNTGLKLSVDIDDSCQVLDAEKLLVATGRTPNTQSLNLAAANIRTRGNHGIEVDSHMCTSREGVYAAGDVTGTDQFVYMAAYGAKIAARNAMNSNSLKYDNAVMPAVVFTDPQVASVGLTEAAATSQGYEVKTSTLTLDNVPRALAARDTRGLIKLVADGSTDKLLGAHILAPEGADSIQAAAIAISAGMTYRQLGEMIFPYLTTVEGLKLAAQTFDMDVKKLSCCAG
ncbi:mercury(II) reductase [Chromatiales bacterium (ex Bugula neritina AB1)]|nr:mercury(II) reductase [Chromatiales bacterium (ex Bugula neritina AB1)]